MNWLAARFPLMAEAGAEGGGAESPAGGAGDETAADAAVGKTQAAEGAGKAEPASALAAAGIAGGAAAGTAAGAAVGKTQAVESALAAKGVAADAATGEARAEDDGLTMTREALGAMSDDDWVKGSLEGVEGVSDDLILRGIAQTCREAGVSPKQMNKIQAKFNEVLNERVAKVQAEKDAEDRARAEKATQESLAAFDDSGWRDILAAQKEYVPEGSELAKMLQGELGSNREMLTILKTLGESLRGDAPSSTGARGSGLSLEERLFQKTVPAGLR